MEDNGGNSANGGNQRPIKDLKGLLKFCMESTKSEDPTHATTYEISPERRQWLEEAMNAMTVDTADSMSKCLKIIEEAEVDSEEGTEQIISALTELEDWVEELDLAQDFITLKGLRVVPGLLSNQVSEIRWRCLELLANLCQNNPRVQAAVLASHFLPPMLMLIQEDDNPTVRVKAIYALSCLSRNNIPVQTELISKGGLTVVVKALQSEEEKARIKASFMLMSIARDNPALKDALLDRNLVEQMIGRLKGEHCVSHEHLMAAFVSLIAGHKRFKNFCLQDKYGLRDFLNARIQFLEGKQELEDEKGHAKEFLSALGATTHQTQTSSSSSLALMPS